MEEKNKKKLFMIGMSVLLVLVLVIGGTYAWFTLQLNGTKVNVLKAGSLSLILNDENSVGINSDKAVPMLDEVGEKETPYHFTLENNSDVPSDYTIYLDDVDLEDTETRMSDHFIKYSLTKDETKTTALLNTTGTHPNRVLDTGTISGNTTITYDLRLWIDSDATNDVMGTILKTKLRVVATQSTSQAKTPNENILKVYHYSEEEATKCITGEETTCTEIMARSNNYEPGTIVKYKVNDTEEKYFHVVSDNGDTLTLQQRENTVEATAWYGEAEDNTKGPLTVLPILENATATWTNVLDQTYTMGSTTFKTNAFTGCTYDNTTNEIICEVNTYIMPSRTAKARMITTQEAGSLGCKYNDNQSCPIWINNYLSNSTGWGGTINKTDIGYWTMSARSATTKYAVGVSTGGRVGDAVITDVRYGARAVVVIDK